MRRPQPTSLLPALLLCAALAAPAAATKRSDAFVQAVDVMWKDFAVKGELGAANGCAKGAESARLFLVTAVKTGDRDTLDLLGARYGSRTQALAVYDILPLVTAARDSCAALYAAVYDRSAAAAPACFAPDGLDWDQVEAAAPRGLDAAQIQLRLAALRRFAPVLEAPRLEARSAAKLAAIDAQVRKTAAAFAKLQHPDSDPSKIAAQYRRKFIRFFGDQCRRRSLRLNEKIAALEARAAELARADNERRRQQRAVTAARRMASQLAPPAAVPQAPQPRLARIRVQAPDLGVFNQRRVETDLRAAVALGRFCDLRCSDDLRRAVWVYENDWSEADRRAHPQQQAFVSRAKRYLELSASFDALRELSGRWYEGESRDRALNGEINARLKELGPAIRRLTEALGGGLPPAGELYRTYKDLALGIARSRAGAQPQGLSPGELVVDGKIVRPGWEGPGKVAGTAAPGGATVRQPRPGVTELRLPNGAKLRALDLAAALAAKTDDERRQVIAKLAARLLAVSGEDKAWVVPLTNFISDYALKATRGIAPASLRLLEQDGVYSLTADGRNVFVAQPRPPSAFRGQGTDRFGRVLAVSAFDEPLLLAEYRLDGKRLQWQEGGAVEGNSQTETVSVRLQSRVPGGWNPTGPKVVLQEISFALPTGVLANFSQAVSASPAGRLADVSAAGYKFTVGAAQDGLARVTGSSGYAVAAMASLYSKQQGDPSYEGWLKFVDAEVMTHPDRDRYAIVSEYALEIRRQTFAENHIIRERFKDPRQFDAMMGALPSTAEMAAAIEKYFAAGHYGTLFGLWADQSKAGLGQMWLNAASVGMQFLEGQGESLLLLGILSELNALQSFTSAAQASAFLRNSHIAIRVVNGTTSVALTGQMLAGAPDDFMGLVEALQSRDPRAAERARQKLGACLNHMMLAAGIGEGRLRPPNPPRVPVTVRPPAAPPAPIEPGTATRLAAGENGEVFRAKNARGPVAVKLSLHEGTLQAESAVMKSAYDAYYDPASALGPPPAGLRLPKLIDLTRIDEKTLSPTRPSRQVQALVMEWVEGPTVKEFTAGGRKIPAALWAGFKAGLERLHRLGYAHNDLFAENIKVVRGPAPGQLELVLLDFGLAKHPADAAALAKDAKQLKSLEANYVQAPVRKAASKTGTETPPPAKKPGAPEKPAAVLSDKELGSGDYGIVFEAVTADGRLAAGKVISFSVSDYGGRMKVAERESTDKAVFRAEVQVRAKVKAVLAKAKRRGSVPEFYGAGTLQADGRVLNGKGRVVGWLPPSTLYAGKKVLLMERINGKTLADRSNTETIGPEALRRFVDDIRLLDEKGVFMTSDWKNQNVMSADGRWVLVDLGNGAPSSKAARDSFGGFLERNWSRIELAKAAPAELMALKGALKKYLKDSMPEGVSRSLDEALSAASTE